jgi:serine/threonine-protein kinase
MNEIQGQLPILAGNKGRYQLLRPLGGGNFGDTFLAIDLDTLTQRHCVIKRLRIDNHYSSEIVAGIKKSL